MSYISYSGFRLKVDCDWAYWHTYVNKTPTPEPDNAVHALYGSTVGKIFEDFYNLKLWKEKPVEQSLLKRVEAAYTFVEKDELRRGRVVIWKGEKGFVGKDGYQNRDELLADVRDAVARGLRTIKFYRLIGPVTQAEVKLNTNVGRFMFGGRADFILRRTSPHHDLVILDGKGSKHRDAYVDPLQVQWYALLHKLKFAHLRDKIGYVYWRFEPPDSLDWIDFSEASVNELHERVLKTLSEIEAKKRLPVSRIKQAFPPKPGAETCRFCSYLKLCPEGAEVRGEKNVSPFKLPVV